MQYKLSTSAIIFLFTFPRQYDTIASMKLIYIAKEDKYVDIDSKFFITDRYTDEDLDLFLQLESEHKKTLPHYSFNELVELFPTAKTAIKDNLKLKIQNLKQQIDNLDLYRDRYTFEVINKIGDLSDQHIMREDMEKMLKEKREEFNRDIRIYTAQLSSLKKGAEKNKGIITDQNIALAKSVPIRNFIKVNSANKALCIFHKEDTPSMHVYKDNKFKCFSGACGKSGTVIDIVMQQNNCSFVEAVKKLL